MAYTNSVYDILGNLYRKFTYKKGQRSAVYGDEYEEDGVEISFGRDKSSIEKMYLLGKGKASYPIVKTKDGKYDKYPLGDRVKALSKDLSLVSELEDLISSGVERIPTISA